MLAQRQENDEARMCAVPTVSLFEIFESGYPSIVIPAFATDDDGGELWLA